MRVSQTRGSSWSGAVPFLVVGGIITLVVVVIAQFVKSSSYPDTEPKACAVPGESSCVWTCTDPLNNGQLYCTDVCYSHCDVWAK